MVLLGGGRFFLAQYLLHGWGAPSGKGGVIRRCFVEMSETVSTAAPAAIAGGWGDGGSIGKNFKFYGFGTKTVSMPARRSCASRRWTNNIRRSRNFEEGAPRGLAPKQQGSSVANVRVPAGRKLG